MTHIARYKIETHLHTPVNSPCGKVPPETIVRRYREAGYSALVVTDHFSLDGFTRTGLDPDGAGDRVEAFLEGYRQVKHFADQVGMKTYYGAELRFLENSNDYLLYGFSHGLLEDPRKIWAMGLAAFGALAREDGAVLIQAHPFRKGCVPVAPCLVDGYEAVNRHDKHANRNELAVALAERYGGIRTSGGDFHDDRDRCIAGIESGWLPADSREFAQLLRSRQYMLLGWEPGEMRA